MRRASGRALLAFAGLLLGVLSAEGWLRWRPPLTPPEFVHGQYAIETSLPLFRIETARGKRYLVQAREACAHEPPQRIPFDVPPGVRRIVVTGESSAESFADALQRAVRAQGLEDRFQVVCAGVAGAPLGAVERFLAEVMAYKPDRVVLVFGHNLMINEPGVYAWARWLRPLKRLRLARMAAFHLSARPQAPEADPLARWEALLSAAAGRAGREGVRLSVATMPANLWYPPRGRPEGAEETALLEVDYREATGDRAGALAALKVFCERSPEPHAMFALAERLYDRGRIEEARRLFQRVSDEDRTRIRPETNRVTRRLAGEGVEILDVETEIARRSPHGIPGWDHFRDNCHLIDDVWDHVSRLYLAAVLERDLGPSVPAPQSISSFIPDWLQRPLGPSARVVSVHRIARHLRAGGKVAWAEIEPGWKDLGAFARLVVAYDYAEAHRRAGRLAEALNANTRALEALGVSPAALNQRAWILLAMGDRAKAGDYARKALERGPAQRAPRFLLAKLENKAPVVP